MCGIAGIFAYHPSANPVSRDNLIRIRDAMTVRGPDDAGVWMGEGDRVTLGHRRLAIIDLSEAGHQPMHSPCMRYTVVFNGEIYNYPALRARLEAEGRIFRTRSDTEVLLHLFEMKGADMLNELRGMYAFGIWDAYKGRLFLARDPYGIKPLYFSDDGWTVRFASQVKALLAGGHISTDPDPAGTCGFYLWGSVPEPYTLYREIRAVPAGHFVFVDAIGPSTPVPFFGIADEFAPQRGFLGDSVDVAARIREAAKESVTAHLLSDVEVGVFLSAGVDSGALLGLVRDAGAQKIRAITLAFAEFRGTIEDESVLAADVAAHYNAEHIVRVVDEVEFRSELPMILEEMDQPSIDGVNTYFVSKAAQEAGLKVALSGLGSDEILCGYPSFYDIPNWVAKTRAMAAVPGLGRAGRRLLQAAGLSLSNPKLVGLPQYGGTYPGAYLLRRGLFLPFELNEVIDDPTFVTEGLRRLDPLGSLERTLVPDPEMPLSRVAVLESSHYMRNQLLRDCDWAGMAHSLEIRTPFVDIEYLKSVAPVTGGLRGRQGKDALARAPDRHVPDHVRSRAKTGFGVPTGAWLQKVLGAEGDSTASKGASSRAWAKHIVKVRDASGVARIKEHAGAIA